MIDNDAILEHIYESVLEEFPEITPVEAEKIARDIFLSLSNSIINRRIEL